MQSNYKVGIDLAYLNRFQDKINDDNFINKVLTTNEIELFDEITNINKRIEFLAGRFACKEAYAKACKKGIGIIDFKDVEILRDDLGAPTINIENADVSISHDQEYVIAIIILGDKDE